MDVNEFQVLIIGLANLSPEKKLEIGQDVILQVKGNVLKIEDSDNQDGTINRKYKIKQIETKVWNES